MLGKEKKSAGIPQYKKNTYFRSCKKGKKTGVLQKEETG